MNREESKTPEVRGDTLVEQRGWSENGVTSSREKNLVIVGFVFGLLVLCLLCAIVMTVVLGSLFPKKDYCFTPHCVKKAGSIMRAMNMTADPCENFFDFVCGGWVEEFDVDEDSEIAIMGKMQTKIYKKFDRIIEGVKSSQNMSLDHSTNHTGDVAYAGVKAIKTYDACNNLYDDYHPEKIVPFAKAFGGWPMATDGWSDDNTSLQQKLNVALGDFGIASLLSIAVEPDDDDPTRNIIKISAPQPAPISSDSLELIAKIAKITYPDSKLIEDDKQKVKEFAEKIAKKLETADDEKVITKVSELKKHLTQVVNWEELLKLLLEGGTATDDAAKVPDLKVVLQNKEVIKEVITLANSEPPRNLNNFLAACVILEHKLLIIKDIKPGVNTQRSSLSTASVLTELKATCLQTVAQLLNFAMDHVFVYKHSQSVEGAGSLISYLRRTFMELIEGYSWLESSTRERLKRKLTLMNNYIDYPGWLMDKKKVDDYYEHYEYDDSSPVAAYFGMVKFGVRKALAAYKDEVDRTKWPKLNLFSVSTVNAFYIPSQNNFVLPRAILNPPIYDEKNPKYLTYGSIGTIIGHEITHGFDSEGRHYDEYGKVSKDIWTQQSTSNYEELSQCFVNQYSKYIVDEANTTVDGNKTLAENIADNGGLRQAYRAYGTWVKEINKGRQELSLPGLAAYGPQQMFFISYGQTWCISAGKEYLRSQVKTDEHTPHKYRVKGTLSNMEEFASAFGCSAGSAMNPSPKCVLW